MYAYAFEYKIIYKNLIKKNFYKDNISVTSIGCGNMIDYWSLVKILNDLGKEDISISYFGIDLIDWNYKIEQRVNDEVEFCNENVVDIFESNDNFSSEIYCFPKSISEFSNEEFKKICKGFETKEIMKDTISIFATIRQHNYYKAIDIRRIRELIESVEKKGFKVTNCVMQGVPYRQGFKDISDYDSLFIYPKKALDKIKSLNKCCKTFIKNSKNCTSKCKKYLTLSLILTTSQINNRIVVLEKI